MSLKRLMLLSLLLGSALIGAASGATINFALLWNEAGMANITQALFNRIFLPSLRNSCPSVSGINDTQFNFLDMPQVGLFDLRLANQQISQLKSSGCLFAGAYNQPELAMFNQPSVPTGVTGFASMSLHNMAPLTLLMTIEGVRRALKQSFSVPTSGLISETLAIILGTGYSLEDTESLIDEYPGVVLFYKLRLGAESSVVSTMKASGAKNFLLASTVEEADNLLAIAYSSLLLLPTYRWFLFNVRLVDKNDFSGFKVVSKNITSMEFGPVETAISNNLILAKEIYAFDMLSIWSIYLRKIVCKEPGNVNQTYSGMTGDFNLMPNGTVVRTDWRMNFYGGLGTERQRIGNWTYSGAFSFAKMPARIANDATILSEMTRNSFRVVTILKTPFVQYKAGLENSTNGTLYDRLEGFAIDICKQILKNMSITDVTFFMQPDGQYGSQDSKGNWNGLVRTLMQGQADMACASLSDTDTRRQAVKFTQPYLTFQLSILYAKTPENPLISMFQFMRPFHLYTWLAVIGSVVGLSIVLAVLHRLSRNESVFSLYETIFFSFASLIQGITGTPPDRPSGQVVIAIYWLFAFVVLVAYVTNYAATRTLSKLQSDITSLSTLYTQSVYEYGTVNGTSYLTMLQNSTDTTQQAIYRYMAADPANRILANLSVAQALVVNGTFALIYDSAMNQYYAQLICNSINTGGFSSQSASFGLPQTAEYDGMINTALSRIINSGQRDTMYNKYFTLPSNQLPNCQSTVFPDLLRYYIPDDPPVFGTKSGALTLKNTLGIAVINLVGCVLTLLLATVEFGYLRCRQWMRKRKLKSEQRQAEATQNFDQMESNA